VVCRWPCLVLAAACSSCDLPHVRAAYFLIVVAIIVGHDRNPLRSLLALLLAALPGIMGATSDSASLSLLGVASLLLGVGQSSTTSLSTAYLAVTLCSSMVVYLKMSFGAWKGGGCCGSCMPLPSTFTPGPLGSQPC
jgi:hypothetical protein